MGLESTVALVVAIFVLAITPGPGVFAIIARALAVGFRPTLLFVFGVIAGDLVYLLLAVLGLGVLVAQYAMAFAVLKVLGGAYLVYLGVQTWRGAHKVDGPLVPSTPAIATRKTHLQSFVSGLGLTLGNPKAVVFYVAFLPAFMDVGALTATGLLEAASVVAVTLFIVLAGYAKAAAQARQALRSQRAMKNLHRGSGGLMVGAGLAVAAS